VTPSNRFSAFWIDFAEFTTHFDRAYACRLPAVQQTPKRPVMCFGEWDAATAGGCLNNSTWSRNPQFFLEVGADGRGRGSSRVVVTLTQPSLYGAEREYLSIGLCVLSGAKRRRLLTLSPDAVLLASPITNTREVTLSLLLPPSGDEPYVVIPYTYDAGETGKLKLAVWSSAPCTLQTLPSKSEWMHAQFGAAWGAESGGVPNGENDYWRNPQWEIGPLPQPTSLRLFLELAQPPPSDEAAQLAIGCLVLSSEVLKTGEIRQEDVLGQTGFERAAQVSCSVDLPASKAPVRLLACTFEPGQVAAFRLHLYSDFPLNATKLALAAEDTLVGEESVGAALGRGESGGSIGETTPTLRSLATPPSRPPAISTPAEVGGTPNARHANGRHANSAATPRSAAALREENEALRTELDKRDRVRQLWAEDDVPADQKKAKTDTKKSKSGACVVQ